MKRLTILTLLLFICSGCGGGSDGEGSSNSPSPPTYDRVDYQRARRVEPTLNQSLEKHRRKLESERRNIEKRYEGKRDSKYDDEMWNWMQKSRLEYAQRVKNELFRGYEEYVHNIDMYLIFINTATKACKENNFKKGIFDKIDEILHNILGVEKHCEREEN